VVDFIFWIPLATLNWEPRFDDLQTIVTHALAWERKLAMRAS
jgi:UDP-glucose 4-epimerase